MNKSLLHKAALWIISVAFFVILVASAIVEGKWIYYGVLVAPVFVFLSLKKPFVFPLGFYAFLIPLDSVLSVTGTDKVVTLTRLLGILTIIVFVFKGSFEKKFKRPDAVVLWCILFILYGILSVTWAIQAEIVIAWIPTIVGLLILYLLTSSYRLTRGEYETLKWFILYGGLTAAVIFINEAMRGSYDIRAIAHRSTLTFGDMASDPNRLAFGLLLPMTVCVEKFVRQTVMLKKGIFAFFIVIMIVCFILTGSRGNMLALGGLLMMYVLFSKQKKSLWAVLILVGTIIALYLPSFFYDRWGSAIDSGGAGRTSIWYVGIRALEKYWLIGAGLSNFDKAYTEFAIYSPTWEYLDRDPHNIYLGVFVELGIIGFALLILIVWKHFQLPKASKSDLDAVMLKAGFLGILISNFFITKIWDKAFWLILMVIVMYHSVLKEEASGGSL